MKNNKTVAIISRHFVANYGSFLQAYATEKILNKMGYNSFTINYVDERELPQNISKTKLSCSRWNKNFFTRILYRLYQEPLNRIKYKHFKKEREIYINQTKEYNSAKQLENDNPIADVYCTGSDQVWNTILNDQFYEPYFLSFIDNSKKISYAASLGTTDIQMFNNPDIVKWLADYKKILVRESSAVKILNLLGFASQQVLDPTLLFNANEWVKLMKIEKTDEKYMLVYQLHDNKDFSDYAKKAAKNKNLKLLRVCFDYKHFFSSGKIIYLPKIREFLKLFYNATYILTDSFHGTAFSINFNKQFIEVLPADKVFPSRNISILKLTGLNSRILTDYSNFSLFNKKIDYNPVNKILNIERKKSIAAFEKAILEDN